MRRLIFVPILWLLTLTAAFGAESWLGLYLQGTKIGYSSTIETDDSLAGKPARKSVSATVIDAGMLGTSLSLRIDSTTWTIADSTAQMEFLVSSSGRTQKLIAKFTPKTIELDIDNNGTKSKKSIVRPKDGEVVDDPVNALMKGGSMSKSFYVLDPLTVSLVKNTATSKGKSKTTVRGQEVEALLIEITEPRSTSRVYVSAKGDLIKAEAAMGIEMIPMPKEEALQGAPAGGPPVDIAEATRIRPTGTMGRIESLKSATLKVTGRDLAQLPSDAHQTVTRQGPSWTIVAHPVPFPATGAKISQSAAALPSWTKPSLYVPASQPSFQKLAKTIIGKETDTVRAARKIHRYVHDLMKPNAGIGVLRDANEILKTCEGVCRDYAILSATLFRAAGIPSRLCSGLIFFDGAFYYHAWVEFWDGKNWIGVDTTRPQPELTPGHIKLAHGSVEQAFTFTFLENTTIQVVRKVSKGAK